MLFRSQSFLSPIIILIFPSRPHQTFMRCGYYARPPASPIPVFGPTAEFPGLVVFSAISPELPASPFSRSIDSAKSRVTFFPQ